MTWRLILRNKFSSARINYTNSVRGSASPFSFKAVSRSLPPAATFLPCPLRINYMLRARLKKSQDKKQLEKERDAIASRRSLSAEAGRGPSAQKEGEGGQGGWIRQSICHPF